MARETGKQRQSRIELTYYRTPDSAARWRGRLTLLFLLAATTWAVAAPYWNGRGLGGVRFLQQDQLASKGPLASPHATWDSQCAACHIPFTPINGSRWSASLNSRSHAGDRQCQTCHGGPEHHASQRVQDVPACAECHRDHRGRDASLLSMSDSLCTACHQNLSQHLTETVKATQVSDSVTIFDQEHHPDFTPPKDFAGPNSGRIKFSHARHLAQGLAAVKGGIPFTFANLDPSDRSRYGWSAGQELARPIQLDCGSCHRLDASGSLAAPASALLPPRAVGDSMLPVNYENHCRACHPLGFEPKDPRRQVPHGLKARQVVEELQRFYRAEVVKSDPELLERFVPPRIIPGKPAPEALERAEKVATEKTLAAIRILFGSAVDEQVRVREGLPLGRGGCVECHELARPVKPLFNMASAASLEIRPVVVRSIWYESAAFNHTSHRAVGCASCHAGTAQSKDQTRLLLPGIAECVSCHAPATTLNGEPRGGAGVACVECHKYHNGDHPAQGVGADARRGTVERTVDQFLSGGPPRGH